MKIILFILIPILFFMTSCTINWNGEKDKKILELERRILEVNRATNSLYKRNPITDEKLFFALEDTKIIENLIWAIIPWERKFFTYDDCSVLYKWKRVSTLCEMWPKPSKDEFEQYIEGALPKKWSIQDITFNSPDSRFTVYKTGFSSFGKFAEYLGLIANKSLYKNYMGKVEYNYSNTWSGSLGQYSIDMQRIYWVDVLFLRNNEILINGLKKIDDESLYPSFVGSNENSAFIWAGSGHIVALKEPSWIQFTLESLKKDPKVINEKIKDFWSGFTLSQTDDETSLSYSGRVIKTWSHTPPKDVPFVWDEGCRELLAIFDETRKNNINPDNYSWKQKAWDLLSTTKKKTCIADNLSHSIHTESISPRFFSIIQSHYEWAESDFFDSISWRILFHIDAGIAGNAYIENNNLYILVNGVYAANEIYTYSFVEKRILKKEVIQDARYEEVLQQFKNHN